MYGTSIKEPSSDAEKAVEIGRVYVANGSVGGSILMMCHRILAIRASVYSCIVPDQFNHRLCVMMCLLTTARRVAYNM
jgi:hypothetical protein